LNKIKIVTIYEFSYHFYIKDVPMFIVFLFISLFYSASGSCMKASKDPDLMAQAREAASGPAASSTVMLIFGKSQEDTLQSSVFASGVVLPGQKHILTCLHGFSEPLQSYDFLAVSSAPDFRLPIENARPYQVRRFTMVPYSHTTLVSKDKEVEFLQLKVEYDAQLRKLLAPTTAEDPDLILDSRPTLYRGAGRNIQSGDLMIIKLLDALDINPCRLGTPSSQGFDAMSYGYGVGIRGGVQRMAARGPVEFNEQHQCFYQKIRAPGGDETRGLFVPGAHPLQRPLLEGESGGGLFNEASELMGIVSMVRDHPLGSLSKKYDQLVAYLDALPDAVKAQPVIEQLYKSVKVSSAVIKARLNQQNFPVCNVWTSLDEMALTWITQQISGAPG